MTDPRSEARAREVLASVGDDDFRKAVLHGGQIDPRMSFNGSTVIKAMLAFAEPAAAMPGVPSREEIARIAHPEAFQEYTQRCLVGSDRHYKARAETQVRRAYEKADAILKLTPSHSGETGEVEYEVWQQNAFGDGDAMVAGSTSLADARHYAAVYGQDAPAWVVEVTRRKLLTSPDDGGLS